MDLETLHNDYLGCASNKKKSADTVIFELHRERNLAWLLEDVNDRTLAALLYAFVAPRPRPREVIACLMPGKVVQFHFDGLVRPEVEKRLTDRTFNNRVGFGPDKAIERLMQDIREVSHNFTRDCWLITRDIKGYFPSSNLDRSYANYRELIEESFPEGEERDDLLYILMRVNYSYPAENVVPISPRRKWEPIVKSGKSVIFNCEDGRGACLGNQYWQVEKNYDLNDFDHWQVDVCGMRYGRFVDDMWWVVDNLEAGLAHVALSEKKLYEEYGYRMHPTKRYQQHVALGGEFISTWFKGNRIYIGNRVVRHCEERIREWNRLASPWMLDHFLASINSYFGMMKHRNAFRIICNLADKVAPEWRKYCEFNPDRRCFVALEGYKHNELLCRRFNFKLHKLSKHHGTRTNQRPGVPAAGAPGKDGIDGCPRCKVRKAGKEVQHPVS